MNQADHLRRFIDPLSRRIRSMLMRATLNSVDDTQDLQVIQVTRLAGEVIDECERVGQYGLTSVPPVGAECIVAQMSSNADHQVILGVDDHSRPHPLTPGQTVIYDSAGTTIKLDASGNVVIVAGTNVIISAPGFFIDGNATIEGNITITGNVTVLGTLNGHAP